MLKRPVLGVIRLYQGTISPIFPAACRYQPTCSHYTYEAVERYGAGRGLWMGVKRISRCRPGGGRGYDPVPEPVSRETPPESADSTVSRETIAE